MFQSYWLRRRVQHSFQLGHKVVREKRANIWRSTLLQTFNYQELKQKRTNPHSVRLTLRWKKTSSVLLHWWGVNFISVFISVQVSQEWGAKSKPRVFHVLNFPQAAPVPAELLWASHVPHHHSTQFTEDRRLKGSRGECCIFFLNPSLHIQYCSAKDRLLWQTGLNII